MQTLESTQISVLPPCSRVFSSVVRGCHALPQVVLVYVSCMNLQAKKPPFLHRLVITTCLHLPASHRMIALYLTKSWSYFPRLAFSTYQHGWDYTAAGLAIQSKLNRLLTHSIAANMAVECLATFSSTAHPERVGLYLLHSGFLQPACASALGFQPFTGSFS